jgi:hypothetical protein
MIESETKVFAHHQHNVKISPEADKIQDEEEN